MNLIRIIAIALVVWILITLFRQYRNKHKTLTGNDKNRVDGGAMLQCMQCQVHIPEREALVKPDGKVFCSPDCARQYNR